MDVRYNGCCWMGNRFCMVFCFFVLYRGCIFNSKVVKKLFEILMVYNCCRVGIRRNLLFGYFFCYVIFCGFIFNNGFVFRCGVCWYSNFVNIRIFCWFKICINLWKCLCYCWYILFCGLCIWFCYGWLNCIGYWFCVV